jgi:hypothetical protein
MDTDIFDIPTVIQLVKNLPPSVDDGSTLIYYEIS